MITWLNEIQLKQKPHSSFFCPRTIFIGLGYAGQRIMRQVAITVQGFRGESLALTRFCLFDAVGDEWKALDAMDMAAYEVAEKVNNPMPRHDVFQVWEPRLEPGCQTLQEALYEIMDPAARESLNSQGYDLHTTINIYLVGDWLDVECNAVLLPLITKFRRFSLSDLQYVVTATLSIAELSEVTISEVQQAMAYAALMELSSALSTATPQRRQLQPVKQTILDHCFLVDRILEGDTHEAVPKTENVLDIIGGYLASFYLGNLRDVPDAASLFHSSYLSDWEIADKIGVVNALGFAAITLPKSVVAAYLGQIEARRMVRDGILGSDEGEINIEGMTLIDLRNLSLSRLFDLLRRRLDGTRINVRIPGVILEGLPLSQWPDAMQQARHQFENGQWHGTLVNIHTNQQGILAATQDAVRESIDQVLHRHPVGWRLAEELLIQLDAYIEEQQTTLAEPEAVPNLRDLDSHFRRLASDWRPFSASIPHILLLLAMVLFVSVCVPMGWPFAVSFAVIGLWWTFWTQNLLPWKIRRLSKILYGAEERFYEIRLQNHLNEEARQLYQLIRDVLGCQVPAANVHLNTEILQIRNWRDRLNMAIRELDEEPEALTENPPYGERLAIRGHELDRLYHHCTTWPVRQITNAFLGDETQIANPAWSWRRITAHDIVERSKGYCVSRYMNALSETDLSLETCLALVGRGSDDNLEDIITQLYMQSRPLIRRNQHHINVNHTTQAFLLAHEADSDRWIQIASKLDLKASLGSPPGYIGIVQIASGIALCDLLVIPRLSQAYNKLPNKSDVHIDNQHKRLSRIDNIV